MKFPTLMFRYFLLSLNALLVFLSIFSDRLKLPYSLVFAGKLHPLMLHLPIGILLIVILIYAVRNKFSTPPGELIRFLFYLGAFTAVITALFGLFLSQEGGYDEQLLFNHQWSGVAISTISAILALGYEPGKHVKILSLTMVLLVPVIVAGSHFGASLTHGEGYLVIEIPENKTKKIVSDSTAIFEAVIEPILESKCYSCHNEKKAKGQLIMTSMQSLLEGGKHGKIWVAGDPLNSHILQRASMDEDNKKHMPPKGKPQLTELEIKLLNDWIKMGADTKKSFVELPKSDSFRIFAASFIPKQQDAQVQYNFTSASPSLIARLESPYLSIQPLYQGSPALRVDFLIREGFSPSILKELNKLAVQVVELNLSSMPVKDEDIVAISKFTNLRYLNLNSSMVTGKGFELLKHCAHLEVISLSGTKVDPGSLILLTSMKQLKKIYCWNSATSMADVNDLKKKYPDIDWEYGFIADTSEHLKLTSPLLRNDEQKVLGKNDAIEFRHPMPGVSIRYTIDGREPDSASSPVYDKAFYISEATRVKAIAVRNGWITSPVADFSFFARGRKPDYSRLLEIPDKPYSANSVELLTDEKKGETSDLKSGWLGYRMGHFDAKFYFKEEVSLHQVVISTAKNIGSFVMPPQKIEVWAGKDSMNNKLIKTIYPVQPKEYEPDRIEAYKVVLDGAYKSVRVVIYPVRSLPKWHGGKGEKAWIFLDEIFFN